MTSQSDAAHEFKDQATERFDRLAETATRTFHNAADQAEQFANRLTDDGRTVGSNVQDVAGSLQKALGASIQEQPLATLAIVGLLGFVLGAVWKS